MQLSLSKLLLLVLISFIAVAYYQRPKPILKDDAAVCAGLAPDPATLPFISYSTSEGFDACVSRCMTSVMSQVCRQLPEHSNVYATHPEMKEQMLAGCHQNIKNFVANNTRCPYLNCEP